MRHGQWPGIPVPGLRDGHPPHSPRLRSWWSSHQSHSVSAQRFHGPPCQWWPARECREPSRRTSRKSCLYRGRHRSSVPSVRQKQAWCRPGAPSLSPSPRSKEWRAGSKSGRQLLPRSVPWQCSDWWEPCRCLPPSMPWAPANRSSQILLPHRFSVRRNRAAGLSLYCFLSFAYLFIKNVIVVIKPYLSLTLHNQSLIEWHSV